ncbi:MAG TPA: pantetheine-phosphate adenylyltransferase [Acidimicrobiia bacterium]|nr:pantetheine-phosphate adenylyltransferase [Acidimicrobiia bacterium]HLF61257.1 pantetheine-phosphate adenylyltransferase [Acidimicrobiia bacterium]
MTKALCPGSFDPPTNGHVDVIERAISSFEEVVIAIVDNPAKAALFTAAERATMLKDLFGDRARVETFSGLLVDFARDTGADVVIKGLRTVGDYEFELQMAQMNRNLTGMETVFMAAKEDWSFVSSSLVKEVARLGGSVSGLVPDVVEKALKERLS